MNPSHLASTEDAKFYTLAKFYPVTQEGMPRCPHAVASSRDKNEAQEFTELAVSGESGVWQEYVP